MRIQESGSYLKAAREKVLGEDYSIEMHFVTTGTATDRAKDGARDLLEPFDEKEVGLIFHSINEVGILLADYEDHICPAIREAEIPVESTANLKVEAILSRSDSNHDIDC